MSRSDYQFLTTWGVHATPQEVVDVLSDASDLPRWWPSVYLEAKVVETGDPAGVGRVEYDWRISARKRLLQVLSPVMRPVLGGNHRWAMEQGERSLRPELARRRAAGDPTVLDALPEPPRPTFDRRRRRRTPA